LVEGGSEHSFGIHVAKLAGMPAEVLARSSSMLKELEASHDMTKGTIKSASKSKMKEAVNQAAENSGMQLSFFQLNDPVLEQIREELVSIDINTLTPVEALMKLNDIKKLTGG
jgi:DNA mismatch repair protein MutS